MQRGQCVPGTTDESRCLTGSFFIRLCTCHNITWLLPLCFNVIVCACIGFANTEISGKFARLAGNGKTERMAKTLKKKKKNKICII